MNHQGFLQPCLAAVANRVRHRRVLWLVDAAYSALSLNWAVDLVASALLLLE